MLWRAPANLDDTIELASVDWKIALRENSLCATFPTLLPFLSSAVSGGGSGAARAWCNAKVCADRPQESTEPEQFIDDVARRQGVDGEFIGMMTAASMKSARIYQAQVDDEHILVALTSGIDNARCAGDIADYRRIDELCDVGTINILVGTTVALTPAAMVEALMVVTEAKCTVFQQQKIVSPVSGRIATGTGTDALAIVCQPPAQARAVKYIGKHTLLGETLAQAVIEALTSSLNYEAEPS